jgi:hypothetical protein
VCNIDSYCCTTAWDNICVQEAQDYCGSNACNGGGGSGCSHSECQAGAALTPACSTCAADVCAYDPYCCNNSWDSICVQTAEDMCVACGGGGGGGGSCVHDECDEGAALNSGCSSCASIVCGSDPYCCNTDWDAQCVTEAEQWCGLSCGGGGGSFCAHDECVSGGPLDEQCSDCAWSVCGYDPYCCSTAWDATCVQEAENDSNCNYCY